MDRWALAQLHRYISHILTEQLSAEAEHFMPVIPVIVYHGSSSWTAPLSLHDWWPPPLRARFAARAAAPPYPDVRASAPARVGELWRWVTLAW